LALSEGLNFSPGLRLENNCSNCGFTQVRMNGLAGNYSQILINSRPVFSALAGVYGLDMIPNNMVERVEVVRGGGSVLYGGNAIAGTVNVITKEPTENTFEIGSNYALTGMKQPDFTLHASGALVSEDGKKGMYLFAYRRQRNEWDANNDGFSEITKLNNQTIGVETFLKPNNRSKIKLNVFGINEFRRGGSQLERPPHQAAIAEQLEHSIINAGLSYELLSSNYKHKLSVYTAAQTVRRNSYYGAGGRILTATDTINEADLLAMNAYGNSQDVSLVGGSQYTYYANDNLIVTAGSELQHNQVKDEMPGYQRNINQSVNTWGNYAQAEIKPLQRLTFLLGGRYDYVTLNGTYNLGLSVFNQNRPFHALVPRAVVKYELYENVQIRSSFAQGYRVPQAFDEDLHIETVNGAARFIRLDENLRTERSNSFSASLNYTKKIGKIQTNWIVEGFYTQLINPFIIVNQTEMPDGLVIMTKRNGVAAVVQGINVESQIAFSRKLSLQLGATLQTSRYAKAENIWTPQNQEQTDSIVTTPYLLRTPDLYGFFTLNYQPILPLQIGLSGVYTGRMYVPHVVAENGYTTINRTPHFFELNLKTAYKLNMSASYYVEFFGGVHNLFNSFQRDFDTGITRDATYIYGPARPRSVFVGVKLGM
jgi:outer membrane receptor for ferrienterochelin and colicins